MLKARGNLSSLPLLVLHVKPFGRMFVIVISKVGVRGTATYNKEARVNPRYPIPCVASLKLGG